MLKLNLNTVHAAELILEDCYGDGEESLVALPHAVQMLIR